MSTFDGGFDEGIVDLLLVINLEHKRVQHSASPVL